MTETEKIGDKIWVLIFNPNEPLGMAFYGVIAIFAAWLVGRAVKMAINRYLDSAENAGADPTSIRFLAKLAGVGIYLVAFVFYAIHIKILQKLGTSLLAGMGVASVVLGLAAQSTLGNLIAGVTLILYRPFKVGDRIQVSAPTGLETGLVVSIELGYTMLRTPDQRMLVIPNSVIASQSSLNLSHTPPRTPCGVSIYVAAGSDAARARQLLLETAKAHPKIAQVDGCFTTRVTSRGVILTLSAACANPDDAAGIKSDLLDNARRQFDAADVRVV